MPTPVTPISSIRKSVRSAAIRLTVVTVTLVVGIGSHSAFATPITVGALSSNDDGSTDVIIDTLNGLEWLRWDVLADLTYAQTLTAIGSGGTHEGFSIAHNAEAQQFLDALFGGSPAPCDASAQGFQLCGDFGSSITPLLGDTCSDGRAKSIPDVPSTVSRPADWHRAYERLN